MKKVISLFLSLVMLLSVTTGLSITAQADETISSITINITTPVPGTKISNIYSTPTHGLSPWKIEGNYLNWYDVTDAKSNDKLLSSDSKFVAGHKYKAVLVSGTNSGYAFADTVSFEMGGVSGVGQQYQGRKKSIVQQFYATFDCDYTYISSVKLSTEALAKGDVLTNDRFTSLTPHVSVLCSFTRNSESVSLGEKVTYGNYGAIVVIVPDETYEFKNPTISLGSNTFTITSYIGRGIIAKSANNLWTINCTHSSTSQKYDATTHWIECAECGDKSNIETHSFTETTVNGNTVYTCSKCGFSKTSKNKVNGYLYADVTGGVEIVAYDGSDTNVVIPSTLDGKKVVSIGTFAFAKYANKTSFKSITIPSSVTTIGNGAFNGCTALVSVNIPSGVKRIESETFSGCTSLASVTIPYGVNYIGSSAFLNTAIASLVIPCSVKTIGSNAFQGCASLGSVVVPDSVSSLGNAVFLNCTSMTKAELGSGVKSVPQSAFDSCSALKTVTLPATITNVYNYAFADSGLTTVNFRGTQSQWNNITITSSSNYNKKLVDAAKNYEYAEKTDVGQHKYITVETVVPTCVDEGYTLNMCEGCGDAFKTDVKKATGIHTYNSGALTTIPTCVSPGEKTYICNVCGAEKREVAVPTGIHTWDEGTIIKAPTYDAEGEKAYTCTVCSETRTEAIAKLSRTSIAKATVSGIKAKTYTGKALTQSITVKLGNTTLKNGTDYTVAYKSNKSVGTATVTITGKGAYTGTITKTFKINPKATTLKKVTSPKSKQMKITWKKQATKTTGYQIQYSTSSKFTKKTTKTVTVKKNKTTKTTVKKLKGKKKYYVRIRTYKTVGKTKYYSSWSKVKTVKTKK